MAEETNGRKAKLSRWNPKQWKPLYEQIVALSAAGKRNKDLAEMFGITEVHVCNILNCATAKLLRREILNNIRERMTGSLPAKMADIQVKAVERIQSFIDDDELAEKSPFAFVDRSMSLLKMANPALAGERPIGGGNTFVGNNQVNNVVLTKEAAAIISESLEKANKARELYGNGDREPKHVIENAEFEELSDAQAR